MQTAVVTIALFILAFVFPPRSEGIESEVRSLVGLREIAVVVEQFKDEAVRDGLSREDIRTFVELRLRQNGIAVVPDEPARLGDAWLYINVTAQKRKDMDLYAVNVALSLNQNAVLLRDPAIIVAGVRTWQRSSVYSGGSASLSETTRRDLGHLLEEFLNDYLAANPKR